MCYIWVGLKLMSPFLRPKAELRTRVRVIDGRRVKRRGTEIEEVMEVERVGDGGVPMEVGFPYWSSHRRNFPPFDPFFVAGNEEREFLAKQVALDLMGDENFQVEEMNKADDMSLLCPVVGCGAHLMSLEDFEDHYHARHTASCSICSRVYPTSRLLSIHISEAHDSFFQAKVARGFPMYECLVEGCGAKMKNYQSRQQHLVDKHKFPMTFEFFKKARPSKQDRQKLHHRQAYNQRSNTKGMEIDSKGNFKQKDEMHKCKQLASKEEEANEMNMEVEEKVDELVSAVSRLTASDSTPTSINFGHRHSKGLTLIPRSVQRTKKPVPSADGKI